MLTPNMGTNRTYRQEAAKSSLAGALFSATQQRVLGLIFGQPDRSFYARELIDQIKAGSGAVQRELARLERSHLVTVRRVGNQKHYQANAGSSIFEELVGIARKTIGFAEPLRAAEAAPGYVVTRARRSGAHPVLRRLRVPPDRLATVCRSHQVRRLSVFGSVTRPDFSASSDIDVLAEFDPAAAPTITTLVDLADDLSALFGGRKVDVATRATLRNPHRRAAISRDLATLYVAD